jgi:hypothetical protein
MSALGIATPLARPRLIARNGIVAEHPHDDRAFSQRFNLGVGASDRQRCTQTPASAAEGSQNRPSRSRVSQSTAIMKAAGGGVEHLGTSIFRRFPQFRAGLVA